MKIDEDDINKKNIFIAATEEDDYTNSTANAAIELEQSLNPASVSASMYSACTNYDEKYKYLYT
jgi:hypothetical protein